MAYGPIMNKKALAIMVCTIMAISIAPANNAQTSTEPTNDSQDRADSSIWGITYDWSDFEGDSFNMTGIDINEINADMKAAASYAGFDLDMIRF